jgi:4-hydroxybenzoate polyprenyltransferase/phosphoserine phosphatase
MSFQSSIMAPLAVDLDGTLVRTDTLHESLINVAKSAPLRLLAIARALRSGKAAFKREIAGNAHLAAGALPYNTELLAYLRVQKAAGRTLGLFTAADQSIADAVANHVGLFDVVCGSDGAVNLSGANKAARIADRLGDNFAYAGDGTVDQPIFARCSSVVLVGPVDRLRAGLPEGTVVEATFPATEPGLRVWAKALRLQHWAKNVLVFLAALLAPPSAAVFAQALVLWVLMGVLASATYLINDLFDLAADRNHPRKRHRPFASGAIKVRTGVVVAGAMIAVTLLLSLLLLPSLCTLALVAYLALTLTYSFSLKHIPMVDVTVLGGLFTLRVLAGALLLPTPISPWLLTFSMLFFFGLAIIKRYAELDRLARASAGDAKARGYTDQDLPILLTSGVASGFSAIVIFMVYLINDQYPRSIYAHPGALWAIMPVLLIWTLRLWHLAVHGRMSEDPVVFALKDRTSLALGAAVVAILFAARL